MRDILLICTTFAMFVFGFYIAKRIDIFVEENQQMLEKEEIRHKYLIQIAAENPVFFSSVSSVMEYCSGSDSRIEFAICSGKPGSLMERLEEGTVDMVLLSEESASKQHTCLDHMKIPFSHGGFSAEAIGLPIQNPDEDTMVYVFWNPSISSPQRDWALLALRRDFCISECS